MITMDDLISRAAACECIGKMIHEYREKDEHALADGMILARRYGIKCLPAVDAAPVVFCKDCKYYDSEPGGDIMMCYNGLGWTEQNDFCSKGERRDEDAAD